MRGRNLVLLGIALAIGLIAVFLANSYFSGVEERQKRLAAEQKLSRIVVASQELAFGSPLSEQNLRLVNWPTNSVPVGAFTSTSAAMSGGRVALRPIVVGEPVLASKVSGVDGRATLSANLPPGKLAFAVPISDVSGVGGFVRPGDRVDVLLTRPIPGAPNPTDKMTDVILEAIPVLGVDQVADEKATTPTISKTATLEVDTFGAQKLALGIQLGTLSLALRNVADQTAGQRPTLIPRYLSSANLIRPPLPAHAQSAMGARPRRARLSTMRKGSIRPKMTVFRGSQASDYEVQSGR
jgi:pilus assembly protein CpaB